jgi:ATP-dependent RNA helicase SrmB
MVNFTFLGLKPGIALKLSSQFKISSPSASQKVLLPLYLSGQNVLLREATGRGKSFGFLLGMTGRKFANVECIGPKAIYIAPTREIALQVFYWCKILNGENAKIVQCAITGQYSKKQEELLQECLPKYLITTPNRIQSLVEKGLINSSGLELLIIDEIDRLISLENPKNKMINEIFSFIRGASQKVQIIAGSASLEDDLIAKIQKEYVNDAVVLDFQNNHKIPNTITHSAYYLDSDGSPIYLNPLKVLNYQNIIENGLAYPDDDDKVLDLIPDLMDKLKEKKALVFASSSVSLRKLVHNLNERGLKADKLLNLQSYDATSDEPPFNSFLDGRINIICASEFEARGLDIPKVSLVFILGPISASSYLHCAGRVGRYQKPGKAISLFGGSRYVKKYLATLHTLLSLNE